MPDDADELVLGLYERMPAIRITELSQEVVSDVSANGTV